MAKLNAVVTNPEAPVEVTVRGTDDQITTERFKNFAEFEEWYNPKLHHFLNTTNNENITAVAIDLKKAKVKKASRARSNPAAGPTPSSKKGAAMSTKSNGKAKSNKEKVAELPAAAKSLAGKVLSRILLKSSGNESLSPTKDKKRYEAHLYIARKGKVKVEHFFRFYPEYVDALKSLIKDGYVAAK